MAKTDNLTDFLTDVANAIRSKKGIAETINPQDFSDEIRSIEGGGGFSVEEIAAAAVKGDIYLSNESVGAYSFYNCTGITSISCPNATSIGTYAFYNAGNATSVYLPKAVSIGAYAVTTKLVTTIDLPECTTLGNNNFNACSKATYVNLPKVQTVGNACLTYIAVTKLVLPECKSIGNSSITSCANIAYVDLPKCTSIVNYGLRNNSKLATLILRSPTMCTLSNYALNSTKIWNKTGYVYVPSALIESYSAATNWTKIATQLRALEDYTVDGTIEGELDSEKI